MYAAFALHQLLIFEDLNGLLDELASYSRELDEMGEATVPLWVIEVPHGGSCENP